MVPPLPPGGDCDTVFRCFFLNCRLWLRSTICCETSAKDLSSWHLHLQCPDRDDAQQCVAAGVQAFCFDSVYRAVGNREATVGLLQCWRIELCMARL